MHARRHAPSLDRYGRYKFDDPAHLVAAAPDEPEDQQHQQDLVSLDPAEQRAIRRISDALFLGLRGSVRLLFFHIVRALLLHSMR